MLKYVQMYMNLDMCVEEVGVQMGSFNWGP